MKSLHCPSCNRQAISLRERIFSSSQIKCKNCDVFLMNNPIHVYGLMFVALVLTFSLGLYSDLTKFLYFVIFITIYWLYCFFMPLTEKKKFKVKPAIPLLWFQSPMVIMLPVVVIVWIIMVIKL